MTEQVRPAVVRVAAGAVRGAVDAGVQVFRGIPYAAPPFGANRMEPPRPVEPWTGERDATAFGPTVPKGGYPPTFAPLFPEVDIAGDECLNLNVWTPDVGAGGLPVLVWVHGGSFMNGSSSVAEYDGAALARDGMVCVTINYRLGADGFLLVDGCHPNLGLLDQVAALRWVQENIAAFGGDPARVTVAGESAGGMSVTTLLAMPSAAGLFAGAAAHSGAGAHSITPAEARMVGGHLAAALGVPADRASVMAVPLADVVQAATDLVTEIQTAPDPAKWGRLALNLLPFAPVVDGTIVPEDPVTAIAAGRGLDVPLLIGSNRDEARLFFVPPGTIDVVDETLLDVFAAGYGLTPDATAVYRGNRGSESLGDVLAAVATDWFYRVPAIRVAEARGAGPTWMYRFDSPDPAANHRLGACHGVDVPYFFGTYELPELRARLGDSPSAAVAEQARRVWVDFVTHGDPGWAPYSVDRRSTALLSGSLQVVDDPCGDERAVWVGVR